MHDPYPFDLGPYARAVSTRSPEAQRWFDRGLNWCYGFNHEEGAACFQKALQHDPACVMAHWGAAYAAGPFYNLIWRDFGEQEASAAITLARHHIALARSFAQGATPLENHLVEAIDQRFQGDGPASPAGYDRWDDDYAAALRRVHRRYPMDHDVMALLVEALIMRTPRRLWDVNTGEPAPGSDAIEANDICERSIALSDEAGEPRHPAIVHMQIHVMEMSHEPERALSAADSLATMCPDAGHMNHMPGHIYVLCGDYAKARTVSEVSIRADDKFADYAGSMNFYVTARCHDLHLMMFTCMFLGQFEPAFAAARKVEAMLTEDILRVQGRPKLAMTTEGYFSMKMHVLVRFGRWQQIIDTPFPGDPDLYLVSTCMYHYARGIAHAALKDAPMAELERRRFHDRLARVPATRRFLSNPARNTLGVGEKMLDGELAYHQGRYDEAFAHLREAVRRDDALGYTEPWAWMHPPRHALAALLLAQGHVQEAEAVYRDDLGLTNRIQRCAQHPQNVWALHGLVECLQRRGDKAELPALQDALKQALLLADVPITSSCLCRTVTPNCCA